MFLKNHVKMVERAENLNYDGGYFCNLALSFQLSTNHEY